MTSTRFKKIGIFGRLEGDTIVETLSRLISLLDRQGCETRVEHALTIVAGKGVAAATREEIAAGSDLIIVIGGDGTLLGAARDVAASGKPVLGINRGRLGFLTDIKPRELEERVIEVLNGDYVEETRNLIQVKLLRQDQEITRSVAMNDIVLHPGQSIRMIEFELTIDSQFVYSQRSDGLIVSTPTGSTAYALSAGGPIMHPRLNALVLVPMFPHTLTSRPLVVDGDREIRIRIGNNNDLLPQVSCDAQSHFDTRQGDELLITKLPHSLQLLHPSQYNYYETCRTKLGWGQRLGKSESADDLES